MRGNKLEVHEPRLVLCCLFQDCCRYLVNLQANVLESHYPAHLGAVTTVCLKALLPIMSSCYGICIQINIPIQSPFMLV